jgi:uncharacterized protein HemY
MGTTDSAAACSTMPPLRFDSSAAPSPRTMQTAAMAATCADAKLRDPSKALALATKAVELDPDNPNYLNTLGTAYYRSGDWKAAIAALEKSMELSEGGNSNDWFLLAMTHWQMGNKDEARQGAPVVRPGRRVDGKERHGQ